MKKIKVVILGLLVIALVVGVAVFLPRYNEAKDIEQMMENGENQANAYASLTECSDRYNDDLAMDKYIEGTQAFYQVYTNQTGEKYKGKNYTELEPAELLELISYSMENMDSEIIEKVESGASTEAYEKIYHSFLLDLIKESIAKAEEETAKAEEEIAKLEEKNIKLIEGYKTLLEEGTITQEQYEEYTKAFN